MSEYSTELLNTNLLPQERKDIGSGEIAGVATAISDRLQIPDDEIPQVQERLTKIAATASTAIREAITISPSDLAEVEDGQIEEVPPSENGFRDKIAERCRKHLPGILSEENKGVLERILLTQPLSEMADGKKKNRALVELVNMLTKMGELFHELTKEIGKIKDYKSPEVQEHMNSWKEMRALQELIQIFKDMINNARSYKSESERDDVLMEQMCSNQRITHLFIELVPEAEKKKTPPTPIEENKPTSFTPPPIPSSSRQGRATSSRRMLPPSGISSKRTRATALRAKNKKRGWGAKFLDLFRKKP